MDLQSAVALTTIPGISRSRAAVALKDLREHVTDHPSLEEVIAACGRATEQEIGALAVLARTDAASLLNAATHANIDVVSCLDDRYPPLLRAIADPPPVLWCRGVVDALSRPAVAIVGSRVATPYALEVAAHLAAELAVAGLVVVSGLARGADGAAHRGCLSAGGATVAVLGCGPDIVYPQRAPHAGRKYLQNRGFGQRARAGRAAAAGALSAAQPPDQWDLAGRCGRRSIGEERLAHHRSICPGAGPGRHGGAGKCVERPEPRLACPAQGRRKGRRVCGRYLGGARLARRGAFSGGTREYSGKSLKKDVLLDRMAPGETYDLDALSSTTGLPAAPNCCRV